MKFNTKSEKETGDIAKKILDKELEKNKKTIVLGLIGNLGAGKTTFIKAVAKNLGVKKHVTSPTFLIIQKYPIEKGDYKTLFHIDTYRLNSPKELISLDFNDIINKEGNIVIVEWADKVKSILPKDTIFINMEYGENKNERIIKINE